jgi:putative flippase GtrA
VLRLIRKLAGDERVRFLAVGGFNTVLGFVLFAGLELLFGRWIGYIVTLLISYVIAICVAFILHRHVTYRVTGTGNVVVDFLRFSSVYLVAIAINLVALPLLVELAHFPPILAQAIITVVTTLVSYFGHKLFSFRRPQPRAKDEVVES